MRKQTKLVAVLSTAALLAIGASMTSFAAQGWVEEDGAWVYYNKDGSKVTDDWKKSGDNWFWLDSDGDMATDMLIEDGDYKYYVDENGAMVRNQWRAIENEDAGDEDEPDYYWYYFQANGKAFQKSGNSDNAFKKSINGKVYIFNEEGQMQYGWVDDNGDRQTGEDAWGQSQGQNGYMYYCGDENDGAMVTGWALIAIQDDDWDPDTYVNGDIFDEDQERWFWFKSNGRRLQDDDRTINGRKYQFDEYGRMLPEWVFGSTGESNSSMSNSDTATKVNASYVNGEKIGTKATSSVATRYAQGDPNYSNQWKYFGDPEDGARVTKGWFQVVPSEWLSADDYDDSEVNWYYSNGDGELYANEFRTIKGKKYAFDSYGAMLTGLKVIEVDNLNKNKIIDVYNGDAYDTEENFVNFYEALATDKDDAGNSLGRSSNSIYTYYFDESSGSANGQMKTGKVTIDLDGDDFTFNFEKSGSQKGRGKNGYDNDDKKVYINGMMAKADKDERFEFALVFKNPTTKSEYVRQYSLDELQELYGSTVFVDATTGSSPSKDNEDYVFYYDFSRNSLLSKLKNSGIGNSSELQEVYVINTSGGVQKNGKNKNGDDAYIITKNRTVEAIYEEQ